MDVVRKKIRLIDEFRISGVDVVVAMSDAEIPHDLDAILATVALFQARSPCPPLRAFSTYYSRACKNAPLCRNQEEFATIALIPPDGSRESARLRPQPLGSDIATSNWGRVTSLAQWAISIIIGIDLEIYFGDRFCIGPETTCSSAFYATKGFDETFGPMGRKSEGNTLWRKARSLGERVAITRDFVEESLPDNCKDQLLGGLEVLASITYYG